MTEKINLQEQLLAKFRDERQLVTVFTTNGYPLKGRIAAFDQFTVVMENKGVQQLVYKHAISTIQTDKPVNLINPDCG